MNSIKLHWRIVPNIHKTINTKSSRALLQNRRGGNTLRLLLWGQHDWYQNQKRKSQNNHRVGPGQVAHLVGISSHLPKACGFDSQSGHIPRLWVQPPSQGVYKRQLWSTFLSLKSINISLGEDLKKKKKKRITGQYIWWTLIQTSSRKY